MCIWGAISNSSHQLRGGLGGHHVDAANQELERGVAAAHTTAEVIGGVLSNIPGVGGTLADVVTTGADTAENLLDRFEQ